MIDVTKLLAELKAARKIVEAARECNGLRGHQRFCDSTLKKEWECSCGFANYYDCVKQYDKERGDN